MATDMLLRAARRTRMDQSTRESLTSAKTMGFIGQWQSYPPFNIIFLDGLVVHPLITSMPS